MPVTPPPIGLLPRKGLLIDGVWTTESSGGTRTHVYPGTGTATLDVPMAGPQEMERAVAAARAALPAWRKTSGDHRRNILMRFADLLDKEAENTVRIGITENGAAISRARLHFKAAVDQFRYMAGWADKLAGEVIPSWPVPGFNYVRPEPYGVVALIIPWNAPMHILGATLAPALVTGNTVVLKPSELAPFSAAKFAELLVEAGLPPGVVNVVPAEVAGSEALVRHPGVDKIHFTGSVPIARRILAGAAPNLTPVGLELGGKSARLVFADCDLDAAVRDAASAATSMSGQGCLLGTRVMVESSIYPEFLDRFTALLAAVVVGDPFDEKVHMGPVVSAAACDRIMTFIEQTTSERGARLAFGGKRLGGDLAGGFFIQPALFADVDNNGPLAQTEIFGPVVAVMPFDSEEQAITMANTSDFGLAGYIHTNNIDRVHRVADALEVGSVWVNGFFFSAGIPFGGVKHSGHGRAGGRQGIEEFSQSKSVWIARR